MAYHVTSDHALEDATDVRFSMRSLLVVMAAGAVLATALGAFLRQFPADARPRLLVFWTILAALLAAIVVFHAWRRRAAEQRAGRGLLRLARHSAFHPSAWAMSLFSGLVLLIALAIWVACSLTIANRAPGAWGKLGDRNKVDLLLLLANSLLVSGAAITSFWWRRIRICENGVVAHNRFLPWANCKRWYWDVDTQDVLVMEFSGHAAVAVKVPRNSRETVAGIMNERSPGKYYD